MKKIKLLSVLLLCSFICHAQTIRSQQTEQRVYSHAVPWTEETTSQKSKYPIYDTTGRSLLITENGDTILENGSIKRKNKFHNANVYQDENRVYRIDTTGNWRNYEAIKKDSEELSKFGIHHYYPLVLEDSGGRVEWLEADSSLVVVDSLRAIKNLISFLKEQFDYQKLLRAKCDILSYVTIDGTISNRKKFYAAEKKYFKLSGRDKEINNMVKQNLKRQKKRQRENEARKLANYKMKI